MRRWLALAGWLAFVALSIAGLHRAGRWFPSNLILEPGGPLEPTLAAGLRLIGLSVGYWLAGSTILYLIGRASRVPAAIRAVRWATLGPVRSLIDRIVSGALVATIGLPISAIAMIDPGYIPVPAGDGAASDRGGADDATSTRQVEDGLPVPGRPAVDPPVPDPPVPDPPAPGPIPPGTVLHPMHPATSSQPFDSPAASPDAPLSLDAIEVVVRPGDHMWALAGERLAVVRGRTVSDPEVALYWLEVIAVNLPRIRSADPDLIFPGEILVLPAIHH